MSDWPLVSVVIPMRNERGHIGKCVQSVVDQDYPSDRLEIIVVDGDSDDGCLEELAHLGDRVRILSNPKRIVPPAMNLGIRAARGDIVARVDAHTTLDPDYIRVGVETLRRTGADNVGGPMHAIGGGRAANGVAAAMGSRFGIGAYFHFGTEEREVDTVYLGMYPRQVFDRIGLFDEEMVRNQDDELNYRLRKSGGRIILNPAMSSRYQNRQSFKRLWRQFYEYGVWKVRVLQKHPRQMSVRQFVPPTFVATVVVTAFFGLFSDLATTLCALAVGSYALALATATAITANRSGWDLAPPIFVSFVIMHVSWGSGFLVGLRRFGRRWWLPEPPPPRLGATQGEATGAR